MDGRVQLPVIKWMQEQYGAPYIDMITEAGPTKYLLEGTEDQLAAVKAKLRISAENHGSGVLAIVGHHDCAGNPCPREEKEEQIKKAVDLVHSWDLQLKVIGLFVNDQWQVETVTE